jgi:endo-1,3(4)-beta-glucanase
MRYGSCLSLSTNTERSQVLYDAQWVKNVWNYAMVELTDPSYGDEW